MLKNKFLLAIVAVMLGTTIKAQTITIDNARLDPGVGISYSAGNSMAIPINTTGGGCFSRANYFVWELFNQSGVTTGYKDSVKFFYATFLNTKLPAGLNGTYYYKVWSTTVGSNVAQSVDFTISTAANINAMAVPLDRNKILFDQHYYGRCDGNVTANLLLKDSSTGSIDSLELIDNYRTTGPFLSQKFVPDGTGKFTLLFHPTQVGAYFRDAYYTAIVKTTSGATISTKAYHIINNNWDIKADVLAKAAGVKSSCTGDTVSLRIETNMSQDPHLQQNFPAALIQIDWNDNTIEQRTICDIVNAGGVIKHIYSKTSCEKNGSTSFTITSTVTNPFNIVNGPGITGTCGPGRQAVSNAQLYSPPQAKMKLIDSVVCGNALDSVYMRNLSDPGQGLANTSSSGGATAICSQLANYTWIIDHDSAHPYYQTPYGKVENKKDTSIKFNSLQAGFHNITLRVSNQYGDDAPCPTSDTTALVCVDTAMIVPSFRMDSAALGTNIKNDSIIGCAPTIKMVNETRRTFCIDSTRFRYIWQVFDASKSGPYKDSNAIPVSSNKFSFKSGENMNTMNPTISFNVTGRYYISLKVKGACDTTQGLLRYVEANGDAGVAFPTGLDSVFYCTPPGTPPNPLTINYDPAAPANMQLYTTGAGGVRDTVRYTFQASAASSLTYLWTVTPGVKGTDWDFVAPTSDTSKYPTIKFMTKGTYTVIDTFRNNCATKVAKQVVDFQLYPGGINALAATDTICHSVQNIRVTGFTADTTQNKNVQVIWTSNDPGGPFSGTNPSGYRFIYPSGGVPPYNGNLSLDTANNMHPIFIPSTLAYAQSCTTGKTYDIKAEIKSLNNKGCTSVIATRKLHILPCVPSNDVTMNICSGTQVNYKITNPVGITFKYDRISSLNVNGSTAGSGGAYVSTITDLLTVIPPSGYVKYQITPKLGRCDGDPYILTVNVQPSPNAPTLNMTYPNNATASMCSGDQLQINLTTGDPTDKFTWTSVKANGHATGNSQQTVPSTGPISDLLTNTVPPNTTYLNDTICYTIKTVSQFACKGDSVTQCIIVTPGPPTAKIVGSNSGSRLVYCDSVCLNLVGNNPTAIGTGTWDVRPSSGLGSLTPTFTSTSASTVQICNLNRAINYWFGYTISPSAPGCRPTTDSIEIYIVDTVSRVYGLKDTVICNVTGTQNISFPMCISLSRPQPHGELYDWIIKSSVGAASTKSSANPSTGTSTCTQINVRDAEVDTVILKAANGVCPSRYDTAIVRLYRKPESGNIGLSPIMSGDHYCQGSDVSISALFDTRYSDVNWWFYENLTLGGTTNVMSNANPLVLNNMQNDIKINAWLISKGWNYGCQDATDSILSSSRTIFVDSPTVKGNLYSQDTIVCKPGSKAKIEVQGYKGTITGWIASTTSATTGYNSPSSPGNPSGGSTPVFPTIPSTIWFRAIIQNGNCSPDTTDPLRIYIPALADSAKILQGDTAICGGTTIMLTGNVPTAGIGYWSQTGGSLIAPGGSGYTFGPKTTQNPLLVNISDYQTYKFSWEINNLTCPPTVSTITVTNTEPIGNNVITPAADTVCKGTIVNFAGSTVTGGGYLPNTTTHYANCEWWRSVDNGTNWTLVSTNCAGYAFSGDTTSLIKRIVKSDSCVSTSNVTQVIVQERIANNVITPATPVCINNTSTITGNLPTGGNGTYNYTWYYGTTADTITHILTNANTNAKDYTSISLTNIMHFKRIVVSGKCSDTTAFATVYVNPDAVANFSSPIYTSCPPFAIDNYVLNTTNANTSYDWYATYHGVRTPIGTSTTSTMPAYALSNGPDTVMITVVANSTNMPACKSDSMSKFFYTSAKPTALFTISTDSGCASSTANKTNFVFTNTTLNQSLFTYQWVLNGGNGNPATATLSPGGYQYPGSNSGNDTTYVISLTAISACGNSQFTDTIKVRTKPSVLFSPVPSYQCSGGIVSFQDFSTASANSTTAWNFGDGSAVDNTPAATQHVYNVANLTTFNACLKRGNECDVDSFCTPVVIAANTVTLNISVNAADKYKCIPDTVTFTSNSNGGTNYVWDFGDGNTSPSVTNGVHTVIHPYTKPGKYLVTLTGSTTCGSVSKFDTVYVYGTPKVNFSVAPGTTICKGDTLWLNNLTDTFTSHTWNYGNGTGSIDYRTYGTSGNYNVYLGAERVHTTPLGGSLTCKDSSAAQIITVRDTLPGSFSITPLGASCLPYNVQFANTTTIATLPYSTNWNFGSTAIPNQTGNTVTQGFNILGQFNVTMTAINAGGCTYIDSQKVVVAGPTGSWTHDTGYVCGNTPVSFNVYGNSYADSIIVDYGDGTIEHNKYVGSTAFTHVYLTGGTYYPNVTLKSLNGCTYFLNSFGAIRVDYVKAAYTVTQTNNCGNTVVRFNNKSTMDQTPAAQTTNWLVDGNLGHTYDTTATFYATATHTVKLQTISVSGCQDSVATVVIDVKVNNIPQILNITRQDTACVNQTIYYVVNVGPSEDPIQTYTWSFANGTQFMSSSSPNASTVYGTAGNGYFDTITVATAYCSAKLVSNRLVINPVPVVSINPSQDTSICLGNSITLTATGAGTNNYVWGPNFGLSTTTGATVVATPTDTVKYFVTGTNIYGCSDSASVGVGVVQPYTVTIVASPNDTICRGETVELKVVTNSVLQPNFVWTPSTGLDTAKGTVVHATPMATTIYTVYANNAAGCFPTTKDSILIGVGDTLHVAFGIDTVRLQGGTQYHLNPFYSDATASTIWTPAKYLDNPIAPNPTATVLDNVCYEVAATSIYGCKDTAQICIQAFCEASQVFIPNTFTPDGNGLNDYFYVTASGIQKVTSFRVFNRWGQVVFERAGFVPPPYQSATFNPANAWDGKFKGVIAPTDSYVYTCEVVCANGTKFVYTGTVTLIK